MIVIKPETVTEAKLIATNVPETDAPAWASGVDNAVDDQVIYQHKIYQAILLVTGAQNQIPPSANPEYWLDLGATNRYRLFDGVVGNPTTQIGTIDFTIQSGGLVNSVALFGVFGLSVQIIVTDAVAGEVYNQTIALLDLSGVTSWYSYFFAPVTENVQELVVLNLPDYAGAQIRIIVDAGIEAAQIGECVIGPQRDIGEALFGTGVGIKSYSRKETDDFGNFTIVPRRFASTADFDLVLDSDQIGSIKRYMASIKDMPVVFIGAADREETFVYGFYQDFQVVISDPLTSSCNLRVEGLT